MGGGECQVAAMKLIVEYLEHVIHFEQLAAEAEDEKFKATLLEQAVA